LHIVATVAVMADARDLQQAVGSGDGAWFAVGDRRGRSTLRAPDGEIASPEQTAQFMPTVFLYDAYPGGIGLSEPLYVRRDELLVRARELLDRCDCNGGCPACVGPILAADESVAVTPKQLAARVLDLLHTR
jgi:DEAD/DEAH box helicase domain-containing protein